eukprot:s730_g19.t1
MQVGVLLGIPTQILHSWATALQVMERRFHIRGATGPPLRSCSGLPEGCGLSVVGMLLINVIADKWLSVRVPSCALWSYVDNLEITGASASTVQQGYAELSHILDMLDVPIDEQKTIFWSTDPTERSHLRASEQPVAYWTRDLGGHVQYSQQLTNSVVTSKIVQFQPRWKSLATSKAGYKKKLHAIQAVAWPNMLHGIASAMVGPSHFDDMRTAALRALGEHRPGLSPIMHLSLICHPKVDPAFYAIWCTLIETRKYIPFEIACPILHDASRSFKIRPKPGPVHLLLHRMAQLHWSWNSVGTFLDEYGVPIDIWQVPIQELMQRACEAWQTQTAGLASTRKTLDGMQFTHAHLSTRKLPTDPTDHSILRTCLNGTFYTADHLPHRDANLSSACPFCGETDSVVHRNWHCDALAQARIECTPEMRSEILAQAPAVFNHGWMPTPQSLQPFRVGLDTIPTDIQPFERSAPAKELDLFTDGSCLGPRDSLTRLASWGVVKACPGGLSDFQPVASGLLPGRFQSVTRAELYAAIVAVNFAIAESLPFRLWIDNQFVVRRIRFFAKCASYTANVTKPNHDLLQMLYDRLAEAQGLFLGVVKVYSHQDLNKVSDPCERWACIGNQAADDVATYEFCNHPHLMALRDKLVHEVAHIENMRNTIHAVFVKVGRLALTMTKRLNQESPEEDPRRDLQLAPPVMQPWIFPASLPEDASHYHFEDWPCLAEWVSSLHQSSGSVYFWSWFQLYADFQAMFPTKGPWFNGKKLRWEARDTMDNAPFVKRSRWLTTYLMNLAKKLGRPLPVTYRLPQSHTIQYWLNCLPVQVSPERAEAPDEWLKTWRPVFTTSKQLQIIA